MSGELIGAGVGIILALMVGAAGWFGRQQHGAEKERRKQAERERDDALARSQDEAPATPGEAARILDRLRRRRERVRHEADRLE